jgi:predicted ATPase
VSLAPLANAVAIAPAIAVALGIAVHGGDPRQAILNALQPKHLLLILDNFEHLLDGADLVVDILQTAPQVTILATSREPLTVRGEHPYHVHGLAYDSDATPTEAVHAAAVRLFVQRAQSVQPHLTIDTHTVADVLRICQLVQGMPLGLELAAAWTATLPVGVIAAEIERSADFLAAAWRDAPVRQRSMRAVFDWSWDLLTSRERQVFTRLAAFRGGFTRDAALTVADASLPLLVDLQRKSLLRRYETDDTELRFDLHQLVHQFVTEHLDAVPEERAAVMTRHSAWYLALAETAAPLLYGPAQVAWLDRIERDHDNIRVALAWLTQQGDWDSALRLAAALRYFWFVRGYHTEGSERLLHLLAQPAAAGHTVARMHALNAAGYLLWVRGNTADAHTVLTEALTIGRALQQQSDTAFTLCYLGAVANAHDEYAVAQQYLEESLAIWRQVGSANNIGLALMFLGDTMLGQGNLHHAQSRFAESADVLKRVDNTSVLPYPLRRLAYVATQQGNVERATALYLDSMQLNWRVGDRQGVAASVVGLAIVAGMRGNWMRAAQLMGAAESLVESIHTQLLPFDRQQRDHVTTLLHTHLDSWERESVWMAGRTLTLEQVREVAHRA